MLKGSLVAIVTPMQDAGALDLPALTRLIDLHISSGTSGIVIVGTTGESPTVNVEEHCLLIKTAVEHAAGRIPVIAGTGANATTEAVELTAYAKKIGASSGLSVVPYYNKPSQEGLYRHFRTIAEKVDLPLILYNVPGRTVADLTGLPLMFMGAHGVISVTANVAPKLMAEMCAAALAGDCPRARAANNRLLPLHRSLFVEANPIPVKWALAEMGLIRGDLRLPLAPLAAAHHEAVRSALREAGCT